VTNKVKPLNHHAYESLFIRDSKKVTGSYKQSKVIVVNYQNL